MSRQRKPPVPDISDLSLIAIAEASRARCEDFLEDAINARIKGQVAKAMVTTHRNQYKEAMNSENSAGRQAAAALLVSEALAKAAQDWASAGVAARRHAHAAQDFCHLLQATVLPLKVMEHHTPQSVQELAQISFLLADLFEEKSQKAGEDVQSWASHLLLQAAATAAKPTGKKQ